MSGCHNHTYFRLALAHKMGCGLASIEFKCESHTFLTSAHICLLLKPKGSNLEMGRSGGYSVAHYPIIIVKIFMT